VVLLNPALSNDSPSPNNTSILTLSPLTSQSHFQQPQINSTFTPITAAATAHSQFNSNFTPNLSSVNGVPTLDQFPENLISSRENSFDWDPLLEGIS